MKTPPAGALRGWQAYAVAVVATSIMLAVRMAFGEALGKQPTLIIFTMSIMVSAYVGGLGAGLLATALTCAVASYFLLPPIYSFAISSSVERWQLFFVVLAGCCISLLNHALHRSRRRVEIVLGELSEQHAHLEQIVFSRTAALAAARDEAEAASRAKSVFLANMSHELRTPLNGIMGMTDLALRRATDPKQIEWLKLGAQSSRHLLAIINDILDLSRIEAEQLTLEEETFSLGRTIDESMRMLDGPALAKGLVLSRELASTLPGLMIGDALRLKQILLNLIGNAVKFSDHGQIVVRAQTTESDGHSLLLRLEVADQGIGLTPEQQAGLFRVFSQVDESFTRKHGGSGLGLAISKRLARLMGGDIGVTSEAGVGSTFWVTARLKRAVGADFINGSDTEPMREMLARRFAGRRILVAEDDSTSQAVASGLLEGAGLVVDMVSNGREAVERARLNSYALILLDMKMPVMDGLEAARAIRALPGMAAIPMLAMTANAFPEDRDRCLAAGMYGHIGKPVAPHILYSSLLQWFGQLAESRTTGPGRGPPHFDHTNPP